MKVIIILLGLLVLIKAFSEQEIEAWLEYKEHYNKTYSGAEDESRLEQFLKTKKRVEEHNKLYKEGKATFEQGINHFADWYPDEFKDLFGVNITKKSHGRFGGPYPTRYQDPGYVQLPSHLDWREYGAVTRVKMQGHCDVCWSFSALGALEAQHFFKTGQLVEFSQQNLIDCIQGSACHGNWMDVAFEYIKNYGVTTDYAYPYLGEYGVGGTCRANINNNAAVPVQGYAEIQSGDELLLQKAVTTIGPVCVTMDIEHESFKTYTRGVYYEPNCRTDKPVHAVLVVGYGTDEDGKDYWLIKNSWDTWWGIQGYMKLSRNRQNHCGVASYASFPIV